MNNGHLEKDEPLSAMETEPGGIMQSKIRHKGIKST